MKLISRFRTAITDAATDEITKFVQANTVKLKGSGGTGTVTGGDCSFC